MESDAIRAFCHSITAENEDGRDVYVRMRLGKGRGRSSTVASGIAATGQTPLALALDLERRYEQLAPEEPLWLEAVLEGTSKVIDTLKLPAIQNRPEEPISPIDQPSDALRWMCKTLEVLATDANRRASESQQLFLNSLGNQMKIWRELTTAQAQLMVHDHLDTTDNVSEALGMVKELLPAVASRISGPQTEPAAHPDVNYEVAADQMIDGLVALAGERPDLITPGRISKLAALVS